MAVRRKMPDAEKPAARKLGAKASSPSFPLKATPPEVDVAKRFLEGVSDKRPASALQRRMQSSGG